MQYSINKIILKSVIKKLLFLTPIISFFFLVIVYTINKKIFSQSAQVIVQLKKKFIFGTTEITGLELNQNFFINFYFFLEQRPMLLVCIMASPVVYLIVNELIRNLVIWQLIQLPARSMVLTLEVRKNTKTYFYRDLKEKGKSKTLPTNYFERKPSGVIFLVKIALSVGYATFCFLLGYPLFFILFCFIGFLTVRFRKPYLTAEGYPFAGYAITVASLLFYKSICSTNPYNTRQVLLDGYAFFWSGFPLLFILFCGAIILALTPYYMIRKVFFSLMYFVNFLIFLLIIVLIVVIGLLNVDLLTILGALYGIFDSFFVEAEHVHSCYIPPSYLTTNYLTPIYGDVLPKAQKFRIFAILVQYSGLFVIFLCCFIVHFYNKEEKKKMSIQNEKKNSTTNKI